MKITKRLVCSMLLAGTLVVPSLVAFAEEAPTTDTTTEVAAIAEVKEEVVAVEVVKTPTNFSYKVAEATEATAVMVEDGVVLTVGDKVDLSVLVGESNESIEFISADKKIATVESLGTPRADGKSETKLTAVAEGETTVTIYTLDGQTMTCKVVVKAVEVATEAVKEETAVEETTEVVAEEAVVTETAEVVVEEAAVVTETTEVVAEVAKTPTNFSYKVAEATEATPVMLEDGVVLTVGDKVDLSVLVGENNESVEFIIADTKVATVENLGTPRADGKSEVKLTAVAEGETTVTIYTLEGQTMTCKVVVKVAQATEEVAPAETTIEATKLTEATPVETPVEASVETPAE